MLERFALKLLIAGVLVLVFIAVLSVPGCGTISGMCQDVSSASNAIAEAAHKNRDAQIRADRSN